MLDRNRFRRVLILLLSLTMVAFSAQVVNSASAAVAAVAPPEQPRTFLNTTYSPPTGGTVAVNAGDDLQAALDTVQPNQILSLAAGATFTGNFVLPNKTGAGWIYFQSSVYNSLPAPGQRVSPADAANMPKIVSPNTDPAISTEEGAHHWRFVGVEITTTHATTTFTNYGLAVLGTGGETAVGQLPNNITFDRTYVHGTETGNIRRCITVNSASTAVVDSHIADCHEEGADSQAICGWNGPGPFKIVNNRMEGAGENVMFGGATATIDNLVAADIEIRHNYFFKPLSWKEPDSPWSVKNLFELKSAERVLVDGNIFQNNWADAQNGFGILFTPRTEDGQNPWARVRDVTFTRNILRNSDSGFNMAGYDSDPSSDPRTSRVLIKDNVIDDPDDPDDPDGVDAGPFRTFQALGGLLDLEISHNTVIGVQSHVVTFECDGDPPIVHTNFIYRNNISNHGDYGVFGSGLGTGTVALETCAPGYEFVANVLAGGEPDYYPPGNFMEPPNSLDEVGFVDLQGGDYRLAPSSPYKNLGTDGLDLGADYAAVLAATQGVLTGR
jgi:hypothetical protein